MERKVERVLDGAELTGFLRELLACLEGQAETALGLPFREVYKLRVALQREANHFTGKVRLRLSAATTTGAAAPDAGESEGGAVERDYGALKKRMTRRLDAVQEAVNASALPPATAAAKFLGDAREMCTYAGKGEPHYAPFLAAAEALQDAVEGDDLDGVRDAIGRLTGLRTACHARYKQK